MWEAGKNQADGLSGLTCGSSLLMESLQNQCVTSGQYTVLHSGEAGIRGFYA